MSSAPTHSVVGASGAIRARRDPRRDVDLAVALSWIPFAATGWLLRADPQGVAWFVSLTLLISLSHQPLTLALVYGDRRNFDLRRRIFTWSPVVLAAAVIAAQHISLTLLAIVAGLWNLEHTLMQRYGIIRIHGRKVGEQEGGLEKTVLFAWLTLALVWVAVDSRTLDHIERAGIGGKNRRGLEFLTDLRPAAQWILPIVGVAAIAVTWRWLRHEARRGAEGSTAKRVYMASTAALFATILFDPVAGLLGFVGAHAVEYFVIVHQSVRSKYADADGDRGAPVGRAVRRLGSTGFIVAYLAVVIGFLTLLDRSASPTAYTVTILTLGGMHVLYDGFIWKRPSPSAGGMLAARS